MKLGVLTKTNEYIETVVSDDSAIPEILTNITEAAAALNKTEVNLERD